MPTATTTRANFRIGEKVRVDARPVQGHCRTPLYLRGKTGVIVDVLGSYKNPERLAYRSPGYPATVLYKVRFQQTSLWPAYPGSATDTLDADIFEHWLFAAKK
jgi:nitrile hydratase subunit beta